MSMHRKPLTQLEEDGLQAHGLDIGTPSQLSDVFRQGIAWALSNDTLAAENQRLQAELNDPDFPPKYARRLIEQLRAELAAHKSTIRTDNSAVIAALQDELENCRLSWGLLNTELAALKGGHGAVVAHSAQWPTTPGIESFQAAFLTKRVWVLAEELEQLKAQQPVAWGVPNTRITESQRFIELLHSAEGCQYPELLVPLYAHPAPQEVGPWVLARELAPEVGRTVLAYYLNSQGKGRTIRAMFVKAWTVEADDISDPDTECVEYCEQSDCYYMTEGWYELIDNWPDYSSVAVIEGVITHWMSLPPAPALSASAGKEP